MSGESAEPADTRNDQAGEDVRLLFISFQRFIRDCKPGQRVLDDSLRDV